MYGGKTMFLYVGLGAVVLGAAGFGYSCFIKDNDSKQRIVRFVSLGICLAGLAAIMLV